MEDTTLIAASRKTNLKTEADRNDETRGYTTNEAGALLDLTFDINRHTHIHRTDNYVYRNIIKKLLS